MVGHKDRGQRLNVGTCVDCRKDIMMFEDQRRFYDNMVAKRPGFVFPKRCEPCIKIKKQKAGRGVRIKELAIDVRQMSDHAINGEYEGHADTLAQELSDLATKIEQCIPKEENDGVGVVR